MVAEAQRSRAPLQRLADRVSGWFVPLVVAAALAAFAGWAIWGPQPSAAFGLTAAVSVLIIACPCAIGLATPMATMAGAGRGARAGVLFKNAEALERFASAGTMVLDKTGTLTEGKPKLVALYSAPGYTESEVLGLAVSLERSSQHPLGAAFLKASQERGLVLSEAQNFDAPAGKGVTGRAGGYDLIIGNRLMLQEGGIGLAGLSAEALRLSEEGATAIFIAIDGKLAAVAGLPIQSNRPHPACSLRSERTAFTSSC